VPGLDAREIDDVILGCAMPEGEQGMNVARIAALRAGLPIETSAMTVNRFCSSGLQAIAIAAERIRAGAAQVIVAGGTESMTMVPMGGNKVSPNPWLVDHSPDTYINMGLGTEHIARRFGITREQADQFSVESHKKALAAIAAGKFKEETVPVEVKVVLQELARLSLPRNQRRRHLRLIRTKGRAQILRWRRWPSSNRLFM
jgi:acetyl-CoA acyltransferase